MPTLKTLRKPATPVAAPGGAAVSVRGLTKRFGQGPVILDDVSLDVAPGEFLCLLGASGCGKSTLLNLVAGLDRPTQGEIAVQGQRPALMFQEPALYPWLTASKNIELALRLRGVGKVERRAEADRLLELVRLEGSGDKRPHELSGGMRQRVAFLRTLLAGSPVLCLDEPFAALDAITRMELRDWLRETLAAEPRATLLVTHDVDDAVALAARVLVLSARPGRVVAEVPPDRERVLAALRA